MRIQDGSSANEEKTVELGEFRKRLSQKLRNSSWELPPGIFFELLNRLKPARVGVFFAESKWGEPQNILSLLATRPEIEVLGPNLDLDLMRFYPFERSRAASSSLQDVQARGAEVMPDLLLVPALACDQKGKRLGRGKGYYDRYLAAHRSRIRASCALLNSNFVFETLPDHYFHEGDQKVDFILTEKQLFSVNAQRNEVLS